jgi:glucose-1-phosphate adenylyltransferase
LTSSDWYHGTADAVRKQLFEIQVTGADEILILSGDHLYRMDYAKMIRFHKMSHADITIAVKPVSREDTSSHADITIAVKPVSREDTSRFGILKSEEDGRIVNFVEKPVDGRGLEDFIVDEGSEIPFIGSMGIYVFKTEVLI